jgi:hypothetical protein
MKMSHVPRQRTKLLMHFWSISLKPMYIFTERRIAILFILKLLLYAPNWMYDITTHLSNNYNIQPTYLQKKKNIKKTVKMY